MKDRLIPLMLAALTAALCITPASALEYTMAPPDDYLFARPTSDDTIYESESVNVDRSKNAALIPPGFGTPTSYLSGSGELLTPNLAPGGLSGGLVNTVGSAAVPSMEDGYPTVNSSGSGTDASYPAVDGSTWTDTTAFTEVTSALYDSGGSLGTLQIPSIGLTVKVYEGTGSTPLAKGAGHFTGTSIWDGNVCIAGHNRGVNNHFGKIHTLAAGATITLTTKLGTRTYAVTEVSKVLETDTSGTAATSDNRITLYTCVMDQRAYRWMVQAVEV